MTINEIGKVKNYAKNMGIDIGDAIRHYNIFRSLNKENCLLKTKVYLQNQGWINFREEFIKNEM